VAPGGARSAVQRKASDYDALGAVEAIAKALGDDEEKDALQLVDRVGGAEEADRILTGYQKQAVSTFGNDTMGQFCKVLVKKGGNLARALDWMFDEGTDVKLVSAVIKACTDADMKKKVLKDYKAKFVSEFGNDDVATLVGDLGGDIVTRLKWMREEGTDWAAMRTAMVAAGPAECLKLVDTDLRELFVSECDDAQMKDAISLMAKTGKLVKRLNWAAAEGIDDPQWYLDTIAGGPAAEAPGVYKDAEVLKVLKGFSVEDRIKVVKACVGTPIEILDLVGKEVKLDRLGPIPAVPGWIDGVAKAGRDPGDLFDLIAGDAANRATWVGLLKGAPLVNLLANQKGVLAPKARVDIFWEAFDPPGASFSVDDILGFWKVLTGRTIPTSGISKFSDTFFDDFEYCKPDLATAKEVMDIIRPGGGSGALGIPPSHLAKADLGFANKKDKEASQNPGSSDVNWTSVYYTTDTIIIVVDASGKMITNGVGMGAGRTPSAAGTNLFQNHVRHEVGHAVGSRTIGTMNQSGDDYAMEYGKWADSSGGDFVTAMWVGAMPAGGSAQLPGTTLTVTNDDVKDYCYNLLDDGEETGEIAKVLPSMTDRLTAIATAGWGGVEMVKYLRAIPAADPKGLRDLAYMYPGYTPTGEMHVYLTRWGNAWRKYPLETFNAFKAVSWYALSSPKEMFAEMYTQHFTPGKPKPGAIAGKDPEVDFFPSLEAQKDKGFGE